MSEEKIKVGVLFSQSGTMAVTEGAHLRGVLLAFEEINAKGGIDGHLIDPIILDPAGDDQRYADMATELLLKHRVNVIFGCCLSSSRKAVLPIVERFNGVLFYPSVYEGFEYSPNVIYGGGVPNQLVIPLLEYIYAHHGRRIALIGSDYLYPREINRVVKEFLEASEGEVVLESYLPLGAGQAEMKIALRQLMQEEPDVIFSTMVGDDIVKLHTLHAEAGIDAPIASLTAAESLLAKMDENVRAGHLAVAPYFGSIDAQVNQDFVAAFKHRFGAEVSPCVYSEICYSLVYIFADAYRLAGQPDSDSILAALSSAVFKSPGGNVFIDMDTNHCTLRPYVGKSNKAGQYDILWKGASVIRPDPYLVSYDRTIENVVTT